MRSLSPAELEAKFPKLCANNYQITSPATPRYNCMAYANNDERHWWESGLYGGKFYWPPHVAVSDTIETWVEVFLSDGYESTDNHDIEPGVEKVAIYVDANSMEPTHVAKSNGHVWKSKLGKGVDIEHKSLDLLIGDQQDEYGIVGKILRRPKHNKTENNA